MQEEVNSELNYLGQYFCRPCTWAVSCKKSCHFVDAVRRLDD
jgi:hypothetical protein